MVEEFSKRVENTVGKGEIAHYEQFLLFPQCFQKACFPGVSKGVIVWEWVKAIIIVNAHIINIFPGFYKYKVRALKCPASGHAHEKPTESYRESNLRPPGRDSYMLTQSLSQPHKILDSCK